MSACEQQKKLMLLLDGELNDADTRELMAHIEQCPSCSAEYQELQAASQMMLQAGDYHMTDDALARLHQNIDAAMSRKVIERVAHRLASMAALVLLAAGLWILRPAAATTTAATNTITVPATWETVALKYTDETAASSADVGVATWMVADLSTKTSSQLH